MPRTIGVIGGGTAGYFAAIALKRRFPSVAITLIESSKIPIIGVGEATTPFMPPFLHDQLGIDVLDFYRQVKPTWKLGIRFEWGLPGDYYFNYPFGGGDLAEAYAQEDDGRNFSFVSAMMNLGKGPVLQRRDGRLISALRETRLAYHLDNRRFVAYLAAHARAVGIDHLDAIVRGVSQAGDGAIDAISLDDGTTRSFDLYLDCTGFRSLLLGGALASPFLDYKPSLFCDTAVVTRAAHGGHIKPYTRATTMSSGWCWTISQVEEDHLGYVFSSAFTSLDEASAELRRVYPSADPEVWSVKFRSGRHRDFWRKNVVAIGNAYGIVEPLESTALHMVIVELARLIAVLGLGGGDEHIEQCNRRIGEHWDYLRWFLAIHYRYNGRLDTPFWRACRASVDVSGLEPEIQAFQERGVSPRRAGTRHDSRDAIFSDLSLEIMLAGQRLPAPRPHPHMTPAAWSRRRTRQDGRARVALSHADALRAVVDHPGMLRRHVAELAGRS